MSFLRAITRFAQEPAPNYVFEMSEAGIAYSIGGKRGFEALPPGTLQASPVEDNLRSPSAAAEAIQRIVPDNGASGGSGKRRRPAAVILPDRAVRVSLLDFDSFPTSAEERLALVRFRVKKTIPFDIDSAAVSYSVRPSSGTKKSVDVIAVTVAFEILARYEALFRGAGFQPGEITASSLAALELYREPGVVVLAKLAGSALTVMALDDGQLRLFRCLPVEDASDEELLSVLHPTFSYVEDELGRSVGKLVTCGLAQPPAGLKVPVEQLRSRLGPVNAANAGLLGYMEGA